MKKLFSLLVLALAALTCNKDAENESIPTYPSALAGNAIDTFSYTANQVQGYRGVEDESAIL